MTKYVDISFRALKVSFGNETGAICSAVGVDSHDVSEIFLADAKLNNSPAYLRPGFAFGGSCLPKDVRALTHVARTHDVDAPLLDHVIPSNEAHLDRVFVKVVELAPRKVGVLGLTFKAGADDLRESPLVELVERLIGKGFEVTIYDPTLKLSRLVGANRAFIDHRLPHLAALLVDDPATVVGYGELLVVGTREESVLAALESVGPDVDVLDLVRLPQGVRDHVAGRYHAIAWAVGESVKRRPPVARELRGTTPVDASAQEPR